MFNVTYEEWRNFNSVCGGDYADDESTSYASGDEMEIGNSTCAFNVYFYYGNGVNDTDSIVTATTQSVRVYSDKSLVSATSALVIAGVTTMFF